MFLKIQLIIFYNRGIVLEGYGVGNLPDLDSAGWIKWLENQHSLGLKVSYIM